MKRILISINLIIGICAFWNSPAQAQPSGEYYRNAVKFEVFSPLLSHITVGYSRFFKPNVAMELRGGVIGVSLNIPYVDKNGFFLKFGPCIYTKTKNAQKSEGQSAILEGLYLRPEIGYTQFKWDDRILGGYPYYTDTIIEVQEKYITLMVNGGVEMNLGKRLGVEIYGGIGYELGYIKLGDEVAERSEYGDFRFSHYGGGSTFPISLTSGLLLSYRF